MNEALHREVEALNLRPDRAIAVHALIDLGVIAEVACQARECLYESRRFAPSGTCRKTVLSLDHRVPMSRGGCHRPSNIRLLHWGCNSAWRKNAEPMGP